MKNKEKYNRLPKSFFEDDNIPTSKKEFDDDYVPFDWVEQIKYEESLGKKVDPKIKEFLDMKDTNYEVCESETKYGKE